MLGNTENAYGQIWHLPTSAEKFTGKNFINLVADVMHKKPQYYILKPYMMNLFGIFSSPVRELVEMQYQNDRDYFFDSSKFEKRFGIKPTTYEEGIRQAISV